MVGAYRRSTGTEVREAAEATMRGSRDEAIEAGGHVLAEWDNEVARRATIIQRAVDEYMAAFREVRQAMVDADHPINAAGRGWRRAPSEWIDAFDAALASVLEQDEKGTQ